MTPDQFEYFAPSSLAEAASLVRDLGDDVKVLSGGQSLLGLLKLRLSSPRHIVDLGRIGGMDDLRQEGDALVIGAMVTYAHLRTSPLVNAACPLLSQAAAVIGDVQIRNRGTIGGAIAHADPASDMCAAVLALDGRLKLVSARGERWVDASSFFVTVYTTALARDEILAEIRVPAIPDWKSAYLKAARRPSDFALVGVAVRAQLHGRTCADIAMAVTGVSDRVFRVRSVEEALKGRPLDAPRIREVAAGSLEGVDVAGDVHASTEYRTQLARVYVARAVEALL